MFWSVIKPEHGRPAVSEFNMPSIYPAAITKQTAFKNVKLWLMHAWFNVETNAEIVKAV